MKFGAQVGVYRNTWEEIASVAKTMEIKAAGTVFGLLTISYLLLADLKKNT